MILCDEVKEESLVRIQGFRMRRRRFLLRNNRRGGILPRSAHGDQEYKQESKTTLPSHTFFKFLIPCVLMYVAMKYQGKSEDPCKTHPQQTWSFIIAIFMYSIILLAMKQSQNQSATLQQFLGLAVLASGVVSSLSLLSLLLPHFLGLILLRTSWALFVLISALPILQSTCNWLLTGIKSVLDVLIYLPRNLFNWSNFSHQLTPQVTRPSV